MDLEKREELYVLLKRLDNFFTIISTSNNVLKSRKIKLSLDEIINKGREVTSMQYEYFVCQREQDYYPETTCGVAGVMMLLKYHHLFQDISFVELATQLRLTVPPEEKGYKSTAPTTGVYPEDIYRFLYKHDIPFRVSFFKDEWGECLNESPILTLMAGNDGIRETFVSEGHWVLLVRKDGSTFTYLDPWYPRKSNKHIAAINEEEFYKYYTGSACQIFGD